MAFKKPIGPAKLAMTFHCFEVLPSDLYENKSYWQMVDEFRETGYISPARTQFEQGLFHMLDTLHAKHMYSLYLSFGNLALKNGLPVLIDVGTVWC